MSPIWKAVLVAGVLIFLWFAVLPKMRYAKENDGNYYLKYAQTIREQGGAGFKELMNWYAESESNRYHPFPGRIGYITLIAGMGGMFGFSFDVLWAISFVSFLLFLVISYLYCRKHFNDDIALAFFVLNASSPFLVHMSRIILPDSCINLLWGTAIWMFLDFIKGPRRVTYWLLIAMLTTALLFKESSVVVLLFILLIACLFHKRGEFLISKSQIAGLILWPLFLAGGIVLACIGPDGLVQVVKALYATHVMDESNRYATQFSSGPWFRYLVDFLLMSPLTLIGFIAYAGYIFVSRRYRWEELYFFVYYVFVYALLSIPQHSKVVRFVINLDMVMSLFTVLLIFRFLKRNIYKESLSILLLTILIVINVNNFTILFHETIILDPITYHLSKLWELL